MFAGDQVAGEQGAIFYGFGVDDDLCFLLGVEAGEFYVGGGQAEGAEVEGCGFKIDMTSDDKAYDFGQNYLNGVGVFELG